MNLSVRPKHDHHTTQRPKNTLFSYSLPFVQPLHRFSSLNNSLFDLQEPSSTPHSECNTQSAPSLPLTWSLPPLSKQRRVFTAKASLATVSLVQVPTLLATSWAASSAASLAAAASTSAARWTLSTLVLNATKTCAVSLLLAPSSDSLLATLAALRSPVFLRLAWFSRPSLPVASMLVTLLPWVQEFEGVLTDKGICLLHHGCMLLRRHCDVSLLINGTW
jgi:hypothetical protein